MLINVDRSTRNGEIVEIWVSENKCTMWCSFACGQNRRMRKIISFLQDFNLQLLMNYSDILSPFVISITVDTH